MSMTILAYRQITKDYDSYDGDVEEALGLSQELVEELTERFFDLRDADGNLIERKESHKVHGNGLVYPYATPIYAVLDPQKARICGNGVEGVSGTADYACVGCGSAYGYGEGTVTYNGGYEPGQLPPSLQKLIAEIAADGLATGVVTSAAGIEIPAGVTSAHVGDVSLTLDPDISASSSAGILSTPSAVATLKRWKRREV